MKIKDIILYLLSAHELKFAAFESCVLDILFPLRAQISDVYIVYKTRKKFQIFFIPGFIQSRASTFPSSSTISSSKIPCKQAGKTSLSCSCTLQMWLAVDFHCSSRKSDSTGVDSTTLYKWLTIACRHFPACL